MQKYRENYDTEQATTNDLKIPKLDIPLLIIDNSKEITQCLSDIFSFYDYQTITTNCPEKGEEIILSKTHPLIVISDIRMPKMSGLKLAEKTHKHRQKHLQPLLINSGSTHLENSKLMELKNSGIIHSFHDKTDLTIEAAVKSISNQLKANLRSSI